MLQLGHQTIRQFLHSTKARNRNRLWLIERTEARFNLVKRIAGAKQRHEYRAVRVADRNTTVDPLDGTRQGRQVERRRIIIENDEVALRHLSVGATGGKPHIKGECGRDPLHGATKPEVQLISELREGCHS